MPETPYWLVSKNRMDDARKSLQWLRGWVKPHVVDAELTEIIRYKTTALACKNCVQNQLKCEHLPTLKDKLKMLCSSGARRPFFMIMFLFFILYSNGVTAIRPFLLQIFQVFGVPIDKNWATVS